MKTSESIGEIAKALTKFQGEVKSPKATTENPFFKSKYATLAQIQDAIRDEAKKNGLSIIQSAGAGNEFSHGAVHITTRIIHESGEWIESDTLMLTPDKPTPQGAGSAITYGRRYSLSAILGISSEEDDDANAAEPDTKKPSKPAKKTATKITQTAIYKKMWATAKEVFQGVGYADEDIKHLLHEHILDTYGLESSTELNGEQIGEIIEWLNGWKLEDS